MKSHHRTDEVGTREGLRTKDGARNIDMHIGHLTFIVIVGGALLGCRYRESRGPVYLSRSGDLACSESSQATHAVGADEQSLHASGVRQVSVQTHEEDEPTADADEATRGAVDITAALVQGRPTKSGPRHVHEVPEEFLDLTLAEVFQQALAHSPIIRDAGGRVMVAPESAASLYDPAIRDTDPLFGTAAALSEFDARWSNTFNYATKDRALNNFTLGGLTQELQQDEVTLRSEMSKTAATGTRMAIRSLTAHDHNNRRSNLFSHAWDAQWEAEVRQPLLQGAGTQFNRIAGPNAQPGLRFANGIILARVNNEINLSSLEQSVRDFANQLETTYWELYLAYREYDSRRQARDAAENTWQAVRAKAEERLAGGEADKEGQARAQFHLYEDLTLESLNGSSRTRGVYETERRLRRLMGLPINDAVLLRPADEPSEAPLAYDWDELLDMAYQRRPELRRQQSVVRQQELRLVATRNFLLPRLDVVSRYRILGFGDDLAGRGPRFSSAYQDLTSGDHQEWEFGMQMDVPLGYRRAYAAVRNAELLLARERAVMLEQREQIALDLSNAVARGMQSQASVRASAARLAAARQRQEATAAAFEADKVSVDLLLEAQEQLYESERRYYETLIEKTLAHKDVSLHSGILLVEIGVELAEGDWDPHCPPAAISVANSQPSP